MAVRVGVDRWIEADEETSQDVDESAENIGGDMYPLPSMMYGIFTYMNGCFGW